MSHRTFDRVENIAIVLLSCSAILLLFWLWSMQNAGGLWAGEQGVGTSFSGGGPAASERYRPAALMMQTEHGRYGLQYDQKAVDALYTRGLKQILESAIAAAKAPEKISESRWQEAVTADGPWLWYDFLADIPVPGWELADGDGVRGFLLTGENGQVKELLLYSDSGNACYRCPMNEAAEVLFPALPAADNGAEFVFEREEEVYAGLSPVGMLLPETGDHTAYGVSSPLSNLSESGRQELLTILNFNPSAVSLYQTSGGIVFREGADNLRLEKDGTLVFHGSFGGEVRYQAASQQVGDLIDRAAELVAQVLPQGDDGARMLCREVLRRENGEVELRFDYLLDGVEVRLADGVPAARFLFREAGLTGFTIRVRQFQPTQTLCPALPVRQAAALLGDADRTGGELRLCYQETGNGTLTVGWILRTETETE